MTLFRNFAILRQQCSNPFAPIQILTGDTRKPCGSRRGRLHDERRSFPRKLCIERRFESSPESRGSQTSGVLPVLFVQAKRIKPFPFRELSRFSKPRISALKHQFRTNKIKSFLELSFRKVAPFGAARSACYSPPLAASFFVAIATIPAAPRLLRRLAATSFSYFL